MRIALATCVLLFTGVSLDQASADPYRWCGVYATSGDDAGTNCGFMTIEQCRASVSGVGGFCTPNQFYDGKPVVTPEAGRTPKPKRAKS